MLFIKDHEDLKKRIETSFVIRQGCQILTLNDKGLNIMYKRIELFVWVQNYFSSVKEQLDKNVWDLAGFLL